MKQPQPFRFTESRENSFERLKSEAGIRNDDALSSNSSTSSRSSQLEESGSQKKSQRPSKTSRKSKKSGGRINNARMSKALVEGMEELQGLRKVLEKQITFSNNRFDQLNTLIASTN